MFDSPATASRHEGGRCPFGARALVLRTEPRRSRGSALAGFDPYRGRPADIGPVRGPRGCLRLPQGRVSTWTGCATARMGGAKARRADGPSVHVGLPAAENAPMLREALDRIAAHAGGHGGRSDVLILGRYRHSRPGNVAGLARQYPGLRFSCMTVHRAKGLEADYVVVLGLCSGRYGFPAEIADDPLLDLVLAAPEGYPHAEERRLLYVAITRARRQVFLLADGGSPSVFATELMDGGYDVTVFGRRPDADVACAVCVEGRLERRENARDGSVFYGCSNWPLCEHRQRACQDCGTGLPVREGSGFRCRDCGAVIEGCPLCKGWLETRMGRYGRFLGCSNWPVCDYTRDTGRKRPGRRGRAGAPGHARRRR